MVAGVENGVEDYLGGRRGDRSDGGSCCWLTLRRKDRAGVVVTCPQVYWSLSLPLSVLSELSILFLAPLFN